MVLYYIHYNEWRFVKISLPCNEFIKRWFSKSKFFWTKMGVVMHNASNEAKWYYQDSYVEYLIWLSWHVKLSIMLEFYLYFIGNLIKTIWHRVPITSLIHVIRRISIIWPSLLSSEWNWLCIKCSKNVLNKNMSSLCVSYTNCTLFIDNFLLNAHRIVLKFGVVSNKIVSMGITLYEKFSFKIGGFALFISMKFDIFSF